MKDKNSFVTESNETHNNKYDYSLVDYHNSQVKVAIKCPEHGIFWQKPNKHVHARQGCPYCRGLNRTTKDFVEKAVLIHGNKYDYSKVVYKNSITKIIIVCKKHGEFKQTPHGHLKGYGCYKCSKHSKIGKNEFTKRANAIHGNKYDYSLVNYETNKNNVKIICEKHGIFDQLPSNHLYNKNGCPCCVDQYSVAQKEIEDFVVLHGFNVERNDRKIINPYELDIFIDNKNFAIEYNGVYYHSYNRIESNGERNYHKNKLIKCRSKGIQLIQIFENEWLYKQRIVKSILLSKLGAIKNKIFARNCSIFELSSKDFNTFCDHNHIQGALNTKYRYGLLYKGHLVLVLGFNRHAKYDFVCTRLCTKRGFVVVGGVGKLFKYFIKSVDTATILTYADARYSEGLVYQNLGFEFIGHTKPNYYYIKGKKLFNRMSFQKKTLKIKLKNFDPILTESENMFNNGYRRIWDAGNFKYVFKKNAK